MSLLVLVSSGVGPASDEVMMEAALNHLEEMKRHTFFGTHKKSGAPSTFSSIQ